MEYKKNDYVTVKIEDIGTEGEGIGKLDGFTLFVKDAVVGDLVEAKILKPKKNYAYARLEKVLKPSPFRVTPKCAFHRQCGGCQLQSLSYEKQLEFKQQKIRNNLIRIGGLAPEYVDERMESIVGMDEPFYYRNKAQYPVGTDKNGEIITGFYAGRTHDIIANTECHLGVPENKEILEIILDYMKQNHVTVYDETTGQGLIRHVLIRKGFTSGELMVCVVINQKKTRVSYAGGARKSESERNIENVRKNARLCGEEGGMRDVLPAQSYLLERLTKIKGMTSVSVSINTEKTNVIMGKEIYTLWGEPTISDTIHVRDMQKESYPVTGDELVFKISPLSFYQVNPVQTEKLYSLALEYAGLTGQETVWDLYCGIGTISLFLAKKAGQVYGVEIVPQAIEDARENAKRNHIENATFFVGKAEEVLPEFYEKSRAEESMLHPDVIVVDPPRKGCDEACLTTMLKMQPKRIVYVSCDSATLARDLKILCEGGYEVKKVRGVDQFGMTVHVETVVLLSQQHADDYIDIELDLEELDLTSAESKASYREIKEYIFKKYGTKVSTLYIAQIKRKCGIELGINYNPSKKENARVPICPIEKEKMILDALKHFKMIE